MVEVRYIVNVIHPFLGMKAKIIRLAHSINPINCKLISAEESSSIHLMKIMKSNSVIT
tara:strand:+ start:293 stop:466 length:174 start_codon:yes stop_codon:yes gene_type:complete